MPQKGLSDPRTFEDTMPHLIGQRLCLPEISIKDATGNRSTGEQASHASQLSVNGEEGKRKKK